MECRADIRRGELYWIDWSPGRGSEQTGKRPGLVVQADAPNRNGHYPNTIVVAVSRSGREIPSHVALAPTEQNGLTAPCYAKCEQLQTMSKERLGERIGNLASTDMSRVGRALKRMMELT